jgi:Tfp pilus assembly protein PilE
MSLLELLIWVAVVLLVIVAISYPAQRRYKKTGKRPSGGAAGAFAVMDELFHPSARETRIVMEEQAVARAPMPSADAEPFTDNVISITLPSSKK